jgi:hypothetical protein
VGFRTGRTGAGNAVKDKYYEIFFGQARALVRLRAPWHALPSSGSGGRSETTGLTAADSALVRARLDAGRAAIASWTGSRRPGSANPDPRTLTIAWPRRPPRSAW